MKSPLKMTNVILLSGLMFGSASLMASPLFIEKPREEMPEFVMPINVTAEDTHLPILDSDVRSRDLLIDRISSHSGFEWANMNAGNRFHALFEKGLSKMDKADEDKLRSFLIESEKNKKKVIVMGFADDEGGYQANNELSLKRAERVAKKIKTLNKDVEVTVLSSVLWPGDPEKARRVDVMYY